MYINSIRSNTVNHKIRNGIGKVFNLDNNLKYTKLTEENLKKLLITLS